MKAIARSWFVVLLLSFITVPLHASTNEFRAFWVTGWNAGFLNQSQVDTLLGVVGDPNSKGAIREANCNAVIVQVRRRFDVCYPSGVGEPYMGGLTPSTFNALEAMIKAAHDTTGGKKRIEVHCWSVVFKTAKGAVYNQHRSTPTGSLTDFDNYWPTRLSSPTGAENGDGAFDPGHPKALEYLVNAHMDLVNFQTTAGLDGTDGHIDGIHYDYIRFEGNSEGFNPTSVNRYKARHGLANDPLAGDALFKQWRRDQVTSFVRQMYARIQKSKPFVKQSGSFVTWNPSPVASTRAAFMNTRPYYDVYSDWDSWGEEGIIDMAVPMTYYRQHQLPDDYVRWINYQKDRKFNRHMVIGPGTYLNTLENAILHLQMTRDPSPAGNHVHGFAGYVYHLPYASGNWATFSPVLQTEVTPTWADIPEMPWKTNPTTGHIMGTITDLSTGAWADHAVVSVTGPVNRNMYVDGTGFYAFIDLPPGSYTVTATKPGYQNAQATVNVAVGAVTGNMYEQNLALATNAAPTIVTHPANQSVQQGTNATFTVVAAGSEPLYYQWKRGGTNLAGANGTSFTLNSVTTNDNGASVSVVVTNALGTIESDAATLTVLPPPVVTGTTLLWTANQDGRDYFSTGHTERGLSYNPATGNLLFISRGPETAIHVLNGDTGAHLRTLTITTNVTGGHYPLQMIGVADDGVVYAANLALSSSTPFRLYRWANDSASTEPTVAFSGDPGLGNNQRWGDTLDIRGKGTNTQVLIASRLGNLVSILTTTNGLDFTANPITVSEVPGGSFGLGVAFGRDNTFWGKTTNEPLRQISFELGAGSGTVARSIDAPIPATVSPIGVNPLLDLVGGISFENPDTLKLFDIASDATPALLASATFPTTNANAFFIGSVDFGRDRVYALNPNNGIIALRLNFAASAAPIITKAEPLNGNRIGLWFNAERRPYMVQASSDLIDWDIVTHDIQQDGYLEVEDTASDSARFYRLMVP